jgi:glycosyltransferase involved in cell wall biosynthesis
LKELLTSIKQEIKVLFTLDSLNRGGAEIWALDICRNAKAYGLHVTVVATGGGTLEEEFRSSGVDFIRLHRRWPVDLNIIRELRKIVRSNKINVVHSQQAVDGLHAYLATMNMGTKRVLSFHGHLPDAKNKWASRFLFARVDANVVGTEQFKSWLTRDLRLNTEENCSVIPYGVDEKRLRSDGAFVRGELGLASGDLLFGMIANFYPAPRKDHMTVCRALPTLFKDFPKAHFVFVYAGGQDEDRSKLNACIEYCQTVGISGRVHFAGARFPAMNVLSSIDALVMSSIHESFGIAVVEAMLIGVPCAVSEIGPLLEVTDAGRCALTFEVGNENDLAEKLKTLAGNGELRAKLATDAQRFARENYSIEANIKALLKLYVSCLKGTQYQ